jgi:hypothetical protein
MKDIDALILKEPPIDYPVLLTASSAALGFYLWQFHLRQEKCSGPYDVLSLADCFTATILTMIVLPILYKV